jgi:hypothetical protein
VEAGGSGRGGKMIKAHEYKDIRELSEAIESVCNTLSTGDVFYVEVDPAGYGPAGLPHSGEGILVVVLTGTPA